MALSSAKLGASLESQTLVLALQCVSSKRIKPDSIKTYLGFLIKKTDLIDWVKLGIADT